MVRADTGEGSGVSTFAAAATMKVDRVPTGVDGFDRVMSGGLVAGNAVLLGGFPGVGKTTLLAAVCASIAERRGAALYASSEESDEGVNRVAQRLGLVTDKVKVIGKGKTTVVERVIEMAEEMRPLPFVTVFDSLQKYTSEYSGGGAGSGAQLIAVGKAISDFCQRNKRCAIAVNQMTNDGELKGGTEAPHAFDAILVFAYAKEDDEDKPDDLDEQPKVLMCEKNRTGEANVKTYWRMDERGRLELLDKRKKVLEFPTKRRGYSRD